LYRDRDKALAHCDGKNCDMAACRRDSFSAKVPVPIAIGTGSYRRTAPPTLSANARCRQLQPETSGIEIVY